MKYSHIYVSPTYIIFGIFSTVNIICSFVIFIILIYCITISFIVCTLSFLYYVLPQYTSVHSVSSIMYCHSTHMYTQFPLLCIATVHICTLSFLYYVLPQYTSVHSVSSIMYCHSTHLYTQFPLLCIATEHICQIHSYSTAMFDHKIVNHICGISQYLNFCLF
jgi:hypothetical protein